MMLVDVTVRDHTGLPILAVEVKAVRGKDPRWAAQVRSSLVAHGFIQPARFFLLVTPETSYLWDESAEEEEGAERPPDVAVATADLIGEDRLGDVRWDGRALELVASSWLASVTNADALEDLPEGGRRLLEESGLDRALRGGVVELHPAGAPPYWRPP
jgi:hypothetical protein